MDLLTQIGLDINKLALTALSAGWAPFLRYLSEIIIILYAVIWVRSRIRGTQAERLVKGVMVLVLICLISWLVGFTLITSLLQQIIPVAVLALLIIFQPEIRRGLGYLGRGKTLRLDLSLVDSHKETSKQAIWEIISAVRELSRTKIGALIVVEPPEGERDYLSPGTPVNAEVSSTLLLSIFFPNSPLHDGAVVIRQNKIVSAGVILPMTDNPKLSYKYGTRHRAAIGLSEIYDGLCVVVSEETGAISAASRGMLVKYSAAEDLADPISYIYYQETESKAPNPLQLFLTLFSRSKKTEQDTADNANVPALESVLEKHAPAPGPLELEDKTTST